MLFGIAGLCALALTLAIDAAVISRNDPTGTWVIPSTSQASPAPLSSAEASRSPTPAAPSPQPARSADTPSVPLVPPGVVALGNLPDTSTERAPRTRADQNRVGLAMSLN
ncbi:MAG: hypothetical protein M3R54_09035 [Chloroflexota bacterium]|nr:hypothetical protein [Chloroflexota bacterium]